MKKYLLPLVLIILIGLPVLGFFYSNSNKTDFPMAGTWVDQGEPIFEKTASVTEEAAMPMVDSQMRISDDSFTPDVERSIIKTAFLSLIVQNPEESSQKIQEIAQAAGGTVSNLELYDNEIFGMGMMEKSAVNTNMNARLTLRIPNDKLSEVLSQIKAEALRVSSENITSTDETEQKLDLEAQLKNLQASEEQLLTLMKQAKNVSETLQVQRELSNTRTQIERLQARLDNLTGAIAMSRVEVNLISQAAGQPIIDPKQAGILEELKLAVKDMVRIYRNLFINGSKLIIILSPIIIIALIILGLKKIKRRAKNN